MKIQVKIILICTVFLLLNIVCYAQDVNPPPPPTGLGPTPPGFPIDQNILFLLIMGLIYGVYSIRCLNKKE